MNIKRIQSFLDKREDIRLEFKEAATGLPNNLFESICAMLNRDGGDILLGVSDDAKVIGINDNQVATIMTNLTNLSNNPQKIEPPFILFPQKYQIDGKWIIHIQVPSSSQVHKTSGIIFDRSNDGDFRVTQAHQIAELHNRKRNYYTEGIIYPALKFEDFKAELFEKVRNLIKSNNANHPWLALNNRQMLEISGLWKRDFQTGQEGYTLAAALLFGKDEVIQQIIPHYKIDAMVRIENVERYDDREYIQTNLIEAYELLMDFVAKHLPDKFYMEGDQRVSLRTKIFREVIANLIVHREYTNAYPCKFIVYPDRVETENANNPRGRGKIDPANFAPFPKNPTIAKFFIQLGRVEELGSGVLNVSNLVKEYTNGGEAIFIEEDIFRMIIPRTENANISIDRFKTLNDVVNDAVNDAVKKGAIDAVSDAVIDAAIDTLKIIEANKDGVTSKSIASQIDRSLASVDRYLKILRKIDLIEFKGASKSGRYFLKEESDLSS